MSLFHYSSVANFDGLLSDFHPLPHFVVSCGPTICFGEQSSNIHFIWCNIVATFSAQYEMPFHFEAPGLLRDILIIRLALLSSARQLKKDV
jgi:hypothetical protein